MGQALRSPSDIWCVISLYSKLLKAVFNSPSAPLCCWVVVETFILLQLAATFPLTEQQLENVVKLPSGSLATKPLASRAKAGRAVHFKGVVGVKKKPANRLFISRCVGKYLQYIQYWGSVMMAACLQAPSSPQPIIAFHSPSCWRWLPACRLSSGVEQLTAPYIWAWFHVTAQNLSYSSVPSCLFGDSRSHRIFNTLIQQQLPRGISPFRRPCFMFFFFFFFKCRLKKKESPRATRSFFAREYNKNGMKKTYQQEARVALCSGFRAPVQTRVGF